MKSCPHCDTRIQVTPEHVEECSQNAARWARVEAMADTATQHTPHAPVTPTHTTGLYATLRSHPRSQSDDQAEATVQALLDLGWRPCLRVPDTTPEPALVGAVQDALDLGGVS